MPGRQSIELAGNCNMSEPDLQLVHKLIDTLTKNNWFWSDTRNIMNTDLKDLLKQIRNFGLHFMYLRYMTVSTKTERWR